MKSGTRTFLGTGWHWPLAINSRGGIALVHEEDDIREAILNILQTSPGERVMRPEYGCNIHNMLFAPINANTIGEITRDVQEAIGRWEPRSEVMEVSVDPDPDNEARLWIRVEYRVKATHDERSLVYPFYVIPED